MENMKSQRIEKKVQGRRGRVRPVISGAGDGRGFKERKRMGRLKKRGVVRLSLLGCAVKKNGGGVGKGRDRQRVR